MKHIAMSLQDAGMIWAASRERPMHVGGFIVLRMPRGAREDYVCRLVRSLKRHPITATPWNYRLGRHASGLIPVWEAVKGADPAAHVVHHALPFPRRATELAALVARLHSQPLDMSRPPWEYHVIEGLTGRRFAIYLKVHHALFDGASGIRAFVQGVSEDPAAAVRPVWTSPRRRLNAAPSHEAEAPKDAAQHVLDTLRQVYSELPALYAALARLAKAGGGKDAHLIAPYSGPHSVLNEPVTQSRSVAARKLSLPRIRTVARRTGTTINDILLAVCGGAMRRYLLERGALPTKSLTAGVPVSLPSAGTHASGNEVGLICASLGSNLKDPLRRLRAIARTTVAGKQHLQAIPSQLRTAYLLLIVLPGFVYSLLPSLGKPISNIAVANMVGPKEPLYLNGALLEEVYPMSVLNGGCSLNISCVSYKDGLYFGLVACPDVIPQIERLALYLHDAFRELETAVRRMKQSGSQ